MKKSLQPDEFDPANDDAATDAAIDQMLSPCRLDCCAIARSAAPPLVLESSYSTRPPARCRKSARPGRSQLDLRYERRSGNARGFEETLRPDRGSLPRPPAFSMKSSGIWRAIARRLSIVRST